jgi:D-xylose 1-dehydrogenase
VNAARYPSLQDQRVLVTGGGTGIGATLVQAFVEQGARVSFLDIADKPSEELAARLGQGARHAPRYLRCDLTQLDQLDSVLQRIGPVDVLVNNAANDSRHHVADVDAARWDASIAVNLRHLFFCAKAAVPAMKAAGGGVMLNQLTGVGLVDFVMGWEGTAGMVGGAVSALHWKRAVPDIE